MSGRKTLRDAVAFGVEGSTFGFRVDRTKTAQSEGCTIGDNVVVHFLSLTVWSDAGSKKKIKNNKKTEEMEKKMASMKVPLDIGRPYLGKKRKKKKIKQQQASYYSYLPPHQSKSVGSHPPSMLCP